MAKHGTLPEHLYQHHLEVGDKVNLDFEVGEDEDFNEHEASEEACVSDEDQQEFDESSDEEVDVTTDDKFHSQGQQDELGTLKNFLFGTSRDMEGR